MITTDALEDIFNAVVKLRQESSGSSRLSNGWLSVDDISLQCQQLGYSRLQRFKLDGDFFAEFVRFHNNTLPRRSMRRVKWVGGL